MEAGVVNAMSLTLVLGFMFIVDMYSLKPAQSQVRRSIQLLLSPEQIRRSIQHQQYQNLVSMTIGLAMVNENQISKVLGTKASDPASGRCQ